MGGGHGLSLLCLPYGYVKPHANDGNEQKTIFVRFSHHFSHMFVLLKHQRPESAFVLIENNMNSTITQC